MTDDSIEEGPPPERARVVVVGAGFGGLWATHRLADKGMDVLLLDRNNYHTFFPLLYQVAAAEIAPTDIAYPVRASLRSTTARFHMAEVTGVDLERRRVETPQGEIGYDALILGLGSVPKFFGVPGAEEHAFRLRTMDDAVPLRRQILSCFEVAERRAPSERSELLTFVIVGGGPTGVEYAGALAELIYGPLARDFPNMPEREPRILLIEAGDRVLPGMADTLSAYALRRLRDRGVDVRLETAVTEIGPQSVLLDSGEEIASETVVWTAGIGGAGGPADWGLPVGPSDRVQVTKELNLPEWPEVFVVGDQAYLEDEQGEAYPQVAQVAMQQGECAADNVLRRFDDEALHPFRYRDLGMLAVIGRGSAVAQFGTKAFTGLPAWALWLAVHIAKLIGFRNRALVLVNWAWNYLNFRRAPRPILPGRDLGPGPP